MTIVDPHPIPGEQLFAISSDGPILPRNLLSQDVAAVPITEYYVHLSNTLEIFDQVIDFDRNARRNPTPKDAGSDYKPTRQQAVSHNSAIAAERLRGEARQEFYMAYGITALQASDLIPATDVEFVAKKAYDSFTMRFAGHHKFDARFKARKLWGGLLHRHLNPNEDTLHQETAEETKREAGPGLSTREKLIILAEAEDAGFLPTTNEEKNMVVTYLDYIRNPDTSRPCFFLH